MFMVRLLFEFRAAAPSCFICMFQHLILSRFLHKQDRAEVEAEETKSYITAYLEETKLKILDTVPKAIQLMFIEALKVFVLLF